MEVQFLRKRCHIHTMGLRKTRQHWTPDYLWPYKTQYVPDKQFYILFLVRHEKVMCKSGDEKNQRKRKNPPKLIKYNPRYGNKSMELPEKLGRWKNTQDVVSIKSLIDIVPSS